jgi:hypothetical protein
LAPRASDTGIDRKASAAAEVEEAAVKDPDMVKLGALMGMTV